MNEELRLAIDEIRLRPNDTVWLIPVKLSPCEVPDFEIGGNASFRDFQWVALYEDWGTGVRRNVYAVAPLPRRLRVWLDLLKSLESRERRMAAEALYNNPEPRALLDLMRALDDRSDPMIGYWAAKALGRIRDPRAVPALIRALRSELSRDYKIVEVLEAFDTDDARRTVKEYREVEHDLVALAKWKLKGKTT